MTFKIYNNSGELMHSSENYTDFSGDSLSDFVTFCIKNKFNLVNAIISEVHLNNLNIFVYNLSEVHFVNCLFDKCFFKCADLVNTSFTNTNFIDCDIYLCNFICAKFNLVLFKDTIIKNSSFVFTNITSSKFEWSSVLTSFIESSGIYNCSFLNSALSGLSFINSTLKENIFDHAKLIHSKLGSSTRVALYTFTSVCFLGTVLNVTDFIGNKIIDAYNITFLNVWDISYTVRNGEVYVKIGCQEKTILEWDYFFSFLCFDHYQHRRTSPEFKLIKANYKAMRAYIKEMGKDLFCYNHKQKGFFELLKDFLLNC